MLDQFEKLKATVKELEEELHSVQTVDDGTRAVLHEVMQEIQSVLHEDGPTAFQPQSVTDRLNQALSQFEDDHPGMAGIIRRLIDGLGQLGI